MAGAGRQYAAIFGRYVPRYVPLGFIGEIVCF